MDIGARAEGDDRHHDVDIDVCRGCFEHAPEHVGIQNAGRREVGRIGHAAEAWHQLGEICLRLLRERWPFDAVGSAEIGDQHDVAAGNRHAGGARPPGKAPVAQQHRDFVEFVAVVDADQAKLAKCAIVDRIRACHGAGMRLRGAATGLGTAELDEDDRLLALGGQFCEHAQLLAVRNALGDHQHDIGLRIVDHIAREIECIEIGVVAAGHRVIDAEASLLCTPHGTDQSESTALRDDADVAGCAGLRRSLQRRCIGQREVVDEVDDAVAVRPHQAHAGAARELAQLRLQFATPLGAGLGKT